MSHELRTPLHAVLGWAQLLGQNEQSAVREGADQILLAGEHLLRLVDETLDLAAVQEGRISMVSESVNLADTVADCLDLVRPLADRRDIVLRIVEDCVDGATVRADRARLHQVLLNLLSNAVKYNRFAGEVTVQWRASDEDRWRVSVRDTGPGIPEAMLSRLFERYERIWAEDSGVEGAGLGLAIARKLLVMMGGEIGVESSPGDGCTFWIDLERAESMQAAA
jgi:signal transduction histidine kinase